MPFFYFKDFFLECHIYIWNLFDLMKMNLKNSMFLIMCRRCICCRCTHRQQWKCEILFHAMHREKDEIIGGLWWQRFYIWKRVNSIKRFFFQETYQTERDVHFKDYQPDVICYQYSNLVCGGCIKLIEVKSNKKIKLEDGICQKLIMKE